MLAEPITYCGDGYRRGKALILGNQPRRHESAVADPGDPAQCCHDVGAAIEAGFF